MTIPYCIVDYDFQAARFVHNVTISDGCFASVAIDWTELHIKHRYANLVCHLPHRVPVGWRQARQLRAILSSSHSVLLYLRDHTNNYTIMPILDTLWAQRVAPRDVVVRVTDQPPLYPRLNETYTL